MIALGTLTITGSGFTGYSGVMAEGPLTITGSTFSQGSDIDTGATLGIENSSFANIAITSVGDQTFIDSKAVCSSDFSVATLTIQNSNALAITNSTFSGNTNAVTMGGSSSAVDNACSGSDITGSTFVSFSSSALTVSSDGTLTSTNNTFSDTSLDSPKLQLYNTILANGSQCVKDATDGKNNLVQAKGFQVCGLTDRINGNIVSFSADLETLTGWPAYFVLGVYSSAINAGDNSICAASPVNNTSENGLTRPQGPRPQCDIGSYEASALDLWQGMFSRIQF